MARRLIASAVTALALTGCATTAANLADRPVAYTIDSAKSPQQLATCIADHMTAGSARNDSEDHYWVVRDTGFGSAIGRWDIYRTPTGSHGEWRRASDLTTGVGAGRDCA